VADPVVARLLGLLSAARRRRLLLILLWALPAVGALGFGAWRLGSAILLGVAVALVAACAAMAWWRLKTLDRHWLLRQLNANVPGADDSLDLLLFAPEAPGTLVRLQQQRLRERLREAPLPDLRSAYPWRRLSLAWLSAAVACGLLSWQPWQGRSLPLFANDASRDDGPIVSGSFEARIGIEPPSYTGLRSTTETSPEVRFPESSQLFWTLRFGTEPSAVSLQFHDGASLVLKRAGEAWVGERRVEASTLYRVVAEGAGIDEQRLYRLDVIPDRAPEIVVRTPQQTLNELSAEQSQWALSFEARDDYGLASAELSISLAQGSGEQIEVREQKRVLDGRGDARERRYEQTLDLKALGFAQGDDLIVRLSVSDNREPTPNVSRSASFILRWPAELGEQGEGLQGVAQKTMPAYFRSQRQIIIDTEALIEQKSALDETEFDKKADAIGVDQKMLRLRYGQFLGEESEGLGREEGHEEHADAQRSAGSQADEVMREFGHTHDIAEAATLLDDQTRQLLRRALAAMWSAEGQLRTSQLQAALPHEHEALEAIKQVQQSTRIYLARMGLDLPAVDPTRRLTGDRSGLSDPPPIALGDDAADAAPVVETWRALDSGTLPDIGALRAWLDAHPQPGDRALALLRSADELRRSPACVECRERFKAQLWPLLPTQRSAVQARSAPDAEAQAYERGLHGARP
jgi:hypothetical protein